MDLNVQRFKSKIQLTTEMENKHKIFFNPNVCQEFSNIYLIFNICDDYVNCMLLKKIPNKKKLLWQRHCSLKW